MDSVIVEIARAVDDLREHGVSFANAATCVDGHYVHLSVMTTACRKMVDVAEKLGLHPQECAD
jgi:phage terminase small subunit